jgi:hypothetical protein
VHDLVEGGESLPSVRVAAAQGDHQPLAARCQAASPRDLGFVDPDDAAHRCDDLVADRRLGGQLV